MIEVRLIRSQNTCSLNEGFVFEPEVFSYNNKKELRRLTGAARKSVLTSKRWLSFLSTFSFKEYDQTYNNLISTNRPTKVVNGSWFGNTVTCWYHTSPWTMNLTLT